MVALDEDKLYFAVLFEKIVSKNFDRPLFLPKRGMLGMVDEDINVFIELTDGVKHLHAFDISETDIPYGFELTVSIKDIVDETGKTNIEEALANLWSFYESQVYFYYQLSDEEMGFVCKDKKEFIDEFGIDFRSISTSEANKVLDEYVEGKLTTNEYYNKVYRKTYNNVIKLFPKK